MRGRYPDSPEELLEALEGTTADKQRVLALMETVFGSARVQQTCANLGIGETRFRQLRELALQERSTRSGPGRRADPAGRLSPTLAHAPARGALVEKEMALQQALVCTEVALILPQRTESETTKKGRQSSVKLRKRKPR